MRNVSIINVYLQKNIVGRIKMSRKKKPRNNDYDPQKLEEAVVQRRIAKENNDLKKLKEAELIIYQYLEKYIRSELSYKYQ